MSGLGGASAARLESPLPLPQRRPSAAALGRRSGPRSPRPRSHSCPRGLAAGLEPPAPHFDQAVGARATRGSWVTSSRVGPGSSAARLSRTRSAVAGSRWLVGSSRASSGGGRAAPAPARSAAAGRPRGGRRRRRRWSAALGQVGGELVDGGEGRRPLDLAHRRAGRPKAMLSAIVPRIAEPSWSRTPIWRRSTPHVELVEGLAVDSDQPAQGL